MTAGVQVAVRCEHPNCQAYHRGPHWRTVSQVADATLEARMSAQAAGWQIRRGHSGVDLCVKHRTRAVA